MHTLAHRVMGLDGVLGPEADRLAERLYDAPTWPARFRILDDTILARIDDAPEPSPGVAWAYHQLLATAGCIRIAALASELGWSRKRLAARFREEVGLPAKSLARILRFRRALGLLERDDDRSVGEIALDCGYFDQAHLNRDFRSFAGCTRRTPSCSASSMPTTFCSPDRCSLRVASATGSGARGCCSRAYPCSASRASPAG